MPTSSKTKYQPANPADHELAIASLFERAKRTGDNNLVPIVDSALELSRVLHELHEDDMQNKPGRIRSLSAVAMSLKKFDRLWAGLDHAKMQAYRPFIIQAAQIWSARATLVGLGIARK